METLVTSSNEIAFCSSASFAQAFHLKVTNCGSRAVRIRAELKEAGFVWTRNNNVAEARLDRVGDFQLIYEPTGPVAPGVTFNLTVVYVPPTQNPANKAVELESSFRFDIEAMGSRCELLLFAFGARSPVEVPVKAVPAAPTLKRTTQPRSTSTVPDDAYRLPATVGFGRVLLLQTVSRKLAVRNTGAVPASFELALHQHASGASSQTGISPASARESVDAVNADDCEFQVRPASGTLMPEEVREVMVSYTPLRFATSTARLILTLSPQHAALPAVTHTIALSGAAAHPGAVRDTVAAAVEATAHTRSVLLLPQATQRFTGPLGSRAGLERSTLPLPQRRSAASLALHEASLRRFQGR